MPNYIVTCRGSLCVSKGDARPTGSIVEMSAADAASLPLGTVELVKSAPPAAPTLKPEAPKAPKEKKS